MPWGVKVEKITDIKPIANADAIECAYINDWPCVVKKGDWAIGDAAVYIPIESLVPESLLEKIGLVGKLAGSKKNRVKAIKLRGQLSIGILVKPEPNMNLGDDVADIYGIIRYEEPIPVELSGKVRNRPQPWIKYDVENIRSYPDEIKDGEEVVIHEKVHGCLKKNTPVLMSNGMLKEIGLIVPGDKVLSFNEKTHSFEEDEVLDVMNSGKSDHISWLELEFDSGLKTICTANHLFLTKNGWKEARDLTELDELQSTEN